MGDMQIDPDSEMDTELGNFVFSSPNIVPSPERIFNPASHSEKIFGGRVNHQQEASAFTFAKPAAIERTGHGYDNRRPNSSLSSRGNKAHKSSFPVQTYTINRNRETTSPVSPDGKQSFRRSSFQSSPFTDTQNIKKASPFTQLEKNSKKKLVTKEVRLELGNSITCVDVPESLLVKSVAKEYFEQYGEILKITVKPKRKIVIVYYPSKEIAKRAYNKAGNFLNQEFKIEWTTPELLNKPKKKESIKGKIASILNIDDEVKEELEAMKGLEYNLPDTTNMWALSAAKAKVKKATKVVAKKEVQKKPLPLVAKPILKTATPTFGTSEDKPALMSLKIDKPALKLEMPVPKVDKTVTSKIEVPVVHQNIIKISSAAIEEMQSQIRQAGSNSEEKFKILDSRDRLMRLKRGKQQSLATAEITRGTCLDMCPEKERYMREFQRQLSSYEQLESSDYKINHQFAVKQYSRSSADQEEPMAHDLRPVKALKMTMSYLLYEIADLCEKEDTNLTEWYHFLWDRMRSVRKDITQQELCCPETVELVEQCARFHILSSERLCAEEASVFDPKINSENLTKCLQTLKYMYYDLRESGVECKNEPEFRAYVILLNLNNGSFISELSTLPSSIQHSAEVKFALEIHSAIAMNNYVRFFKLVRKTTYLNGCILLRYFNQVRIQALKVMVKAYCRTSGSTEYPLYELIDILGFEDEDETFDFCNQVGLKCDRDSLFIKLNKESFHMPRNNMEQGRAQDLILSKRLQSRQSVGQCIAGGVLLEKSYENHKTHSSFDDQGYLLRSSISAQDQNLARDPYEFQDQDDDMEFFSQTKAAGKVLNNFENRRQPDAPIKTSKESAVKSKAEGIAAVTTNNVFSPVSTAVGSTSKTTATTNLFSPVPSSAPSIFAKPASMAFSAIPTKPSVLPIDSSFAMTVNKSIFSGSNQANLFKPPTVGSIPYVNFKPSDAAATARISSPASTAQSVTETTTAKSDSATSERVATKRRLEDSRRAAEKKALTEKEELLRKQLELKYKMDAEQKRLRFLERINEQALESYDQLLKEVVAETCSEVARAELRESLSNELYEEVLSEMCETVLRDQLFIQDALIEVESRLRERLVMKYYQIWKQWAARRRVQRREALDNTPVWMQPDSLQECAKKLYRPEQKIAIKYAMENKKRKSWSIEEDKKNEHKYAPIQYVIYVGLKENANSLDTELRQHNFWKMVISWPFLENRLTLWRHKKLVNKYLSPADTTLEPIIIHHKPNSLESLDICIRYSEGLISENCIIGMDALLFIVGADEDVRSVQRRLSKAVLSRVKLMPIPVVIIVFGDEKISAKNFKMPMLEDLLESGHVSEYSILYENSIDENIVLRIFQSATLWLAINRSPAVPLEMDYLKKIFDDCLSEELWLRIKGYLSLTPWLSDALKDPNFIINLHNEAITYMTDLILDPESMTYSEFAPELKIFLNKIRAYPCTYEYYDSVWKHPEYRAELERIMNNFIFPPWNEDWPITDTIEAYDAIIDYCRQIISYESSIPVTNNIMSDMFLLTDENDEDSYPSFIDVILHIMNKKINDIGGNTRVVYNKNHIKHFQTLPWWYKSSTLSKYVNQHKKEESEEEEEEAEVYNLSEVESSQNIAFPKSQMELDDFDCDIDELNETCKQQDEENPIENICNETLSHVTEIETAAQKFERELEEQKSRNKDFEEKLLKALEDDSM
ncbi:germinal-center associated nuclear protein [Copidosoma floridanum]|uniref:germinal-center associated nuclear protein n=1 Tax=Copidosoma floridanum TaxID=29053 RepID=UPI0006C96E41|nr:germinal-center associated nuclear protein [Copidosoma floridanum]